MLHEMSRRLLGFDDILLLHDHAIVELGALQYLRLRHHMLVWCMTMKAQRWWLLRCCEGIEPQIQALRSVSRMREAIGATVPQRPLRNHVVHCRSRKRFGLLDHCVIVRLFCRPTSEMWCCSIQTIHERMILRLDGVSVAP